MGIKWTREGTPIVVTEQDQGASLGTLGCVFVLMAIVGLIAKACGAM